MDLTVAQLKVGTRLVFGNYSVGVCTSPIAWLKTSKENDFITEDALDYIAFDARERQSPNGDNRYTGNRDYESSNILQFLNGVDDDWYTPAHEYDMPPERRGTSDWSAQYAEYPGFLSQFAEYEQASIDGRVDLPTVQNILGDNAWQLFHRKGVRAKAVNGLYESKLRELGFAANTYVDFWTRDESRPHATRVATIGRNGEVSAKHPYAGCGLRPVLKLKPDTKVMVSADGQYIIQPFEVASTVVPCSADDLFRYLKLSS